MSVLSRLWKKESYEFVPKDDSRDEQIIEFIVHNNRLEGQIVDTQDVETLRAMSRGEISCDEAIRQVFEQYGCTAEVK